MDIKTLIEQCRQDNAWSLGNQILYDMCVKYPFHKDNKEVIAKTWLIGRSYACSIERRKTPDDSISDDFYINKVAPLIIESDLDSWIRNVKNEKSLEVTLRTHKYLVDLLKSISGHETRSFASKYLHFHLPYDFFIYDSRAVSAIGILSRLLGRGRINYDRDKKIYDYEYGKYYEKCLAVLDKIREKHYVTLTCRQLDNILMEIANDKIRNG